MFTLGCSKRNDLPPYTHTNRLNQIEPVPKNDYLFLELKRKNFTFSLTTKVKQINH